MSEGYGQVTSDHSIVSPSHASTRTSLVGVAAGKHRVEVFDFSYGVYANGRRVICFAEGRIGYREWARWSGRLADIHSIDDRYDHDIDELMA